VLDHEAFPHLMDAIVAASDDASLLHLRSACRGFRDRVDRLLAHHVHITCLSPHPTRATERVHITSQLGRFPGFSPCVYYWDAMGRMPWPPPTPPPVLHRQAQVLRHTRVADIHGALPEPAAAWLGRNLGRGHIETLRLFPDARGRTLRAGLPGPVDTLVLFPVPPPVRMPLGLGALVQLQPEHAVLAPTGVRRFVVHVRVDDGPLAFPLSFKAGRDVGFTRVPGLKPSEAPCPSTADRAGELAAYILGMMPFLSANITLVGLDDVDPALSSGVLRKRIVELLDFLGLNDKFVLHPQQAPPKPKDWSWAWNSRQIQDRVLCLSKEDYADTVGPDQWAVEMEE
jgi:hypothetical protein